MAICTDDSGFVAFRLEDIRLVDFGAEPRPPSPAVSVPVRRPQESTSQRSAVAVFKECLVQEEDDLGASFMSPIRERPQHSPVGGSCANHWYRLMRSGLLMPPVRGSVRSARGGLAHVSWW
jgi:hypothetical protein